jgi:valyl-tRNA synthetase
MIRSKMNVPPGKKADLIIRNVNGYRSNIESFDDIIKALAKINQISIGKDIKKPDQSATAVVKKMELFVPLKGLINLDHETVRLTKRLDELTSHLNSVEKKLKNERFIENAPKSVIDHEKQKFKDMNDEFDLIKTNLDILQ